MSQNKQPEALRFSVESEMSRAFEIECGQSWTDPDWRREAGIWASAWHKATNAELLRLHAESELHLQELRSYRITVESREARIAELEAQLIAEAARTAEQKLRADQLEHQHAMQAKMHAQAVEQLAAAQQAVKAVTNAHNAAVRQLRAIATLAKQGGQ